MVKAPGTCCYWPHSSCQGLLLLLILLSTRGSLREREQLFLVATLADSNYLANISFAGIFCFFRKFNVSATADN